MSFLPHIVNTDAEILLGHYVLDRAIELLQRLFEAGCEVSLSINISPRQLTDAWFKRQVEQYARQYPEIIQLLCLEILESDSFDNLPLIQDSLKAYQACGVRLSLDNFGTGFASINNLMRLPLNEVKIDRDFIKDIDSDDMYRIVVRHIVELSSALKLTTVAEGIETEAEAITVAQLGVQFAQGYYFARPFPSAKLLSWLSDYQKLGTV